MKHQWYVYSIQHSTSGKLIMLTFVPQPCIVISRLVWSIGWFVAKFIYYSKIVTISKISLNNSHLKLLVDYMLNIKCCQVSGFASKFNSFMKANHIFVTDTLLIEWTNQVALLIFELFVWCANVLIWLVVSNQWNGVWRSKQLVTLNITHKHRGLRTLIINRFGEKEVRVL